MSSLSTYAGRRVLVTGGLGFIGSNLALRLVELGAQVSVLDSSVAGCGANVHNLAPAWSQLDVVERDIGEAASLPSLLRDCSIVFNLAGEISHINSMQFPERDLEINTIAQLRFLLACKEHCPGVRIVYAGTRQVVGVPEYLPVDECHPVRPVDFNGVHKYAATMYHEMFTRSGDLDAIVLRLTNTYGPRMALDLPTQGFLGVFFRLALLGQTIEIFGDGSQLRDPVYIDDVVDAFLRAGAVPAPRSRTYNVGAAEPVALRQIAEAIVATTGKGSVRYRPFPEDRKAIDIGSYSTDSRRIRAELGWRDSVSLEEGLRRTVHYYRANLHHYIDPDHPVVSSKLPEHQGVKRRLMLAAV